MKVLVTGGVRSGKSAHAESLLGDGPATYVATGAAPGDDADWAARVEAHRVRRPAAWTTLESADLGAACAVDGPVLIDSLGTWLTALLDSHDAWDLPSDEAVTLLDQALTPALAALQGRTADTVIVTNEVGLGVIAEHRSGRLFADLLGLANQRIATACDAVHLVVAGRVLTL